MHKLTKITPLIRKEIWRKYKEYLRKTKGKNKEIILNELKDFYRVHYNTIRKILKRARKRDFTVHLSTRNDNVGWKYKLYVKVEKKLLKRLKRENEIIRYEKEMAGELVHIDLHKRKNIKGENPKKKKYIAGVIDDATRIQYSEELSDKKAKTLAGFIKRAYLWFKKKGVIIKNLMSDNGLEFTTHHKLSRSKHSFEIALNKLNIIHKYTKVRRPQTNGKIERFWKIFEEQFFRKYDFKSTKDFNIKFKDWLVYYNTIRKHGGLNYITPMQKLENILI